MTASYTTTCALLNDLIVACHDEVRIHRAAADMASSYDERLELRRSAQRRAVFAEELAKIVGALGGSASRGGSTAETFRAATARLGGRLFGRKEERVLEARARIEGRVDALFEVAARQALPDRARAAIVRQVTELRNERAALRRAGPKPT